VNCLPYDNSYRRYSFRQFNTRIGRQGKLVKNREKTREMTVVLVRIILGDCGTLSFGQIVRKSPAAPTVLVQRFGGFDGLVRMLRTSRVVRLFEFCSERHGGAGRKAKGIHSSWNPGRGSLQLSAGFPSRSGKVASYHARRACRMRDEHGRSRGGMKALSAIGESAAANASNRSVRLLKQAVRDSPFFQAPC
jgi:hypothetical protein